MRIDSADPVKSSKRSVFELVTWAVAVAVVLPAVYFFFWLLTSNTIKPHSAAEHEPGSVIQELEAITLPQEKSSPIAQTQQGLSAVESQPDPKGEDKRGEIFMGLMGYNKGMEWAENYGRVPTRAEYEAIVATVVAMGADDPNQALTQKLTEAFLEAFRSGCKAGLDQRLPAF